MKKKYGLIKKKGLDITIIYASPVSLLVYDTYTIYGWFLVEPNETFVIVSKNYIDKCSKQNFRSPIIFK